MDEGDGSSRWCRQDDRPESDVLKEEDTWPVSPRYCVRCGQDKDSPPKDALTSTGILDFQGGDFLFAYCINCASEGQMLLGTTQQDLVEYFRVFRVAPWSRAGLDTARRQELIGLSVSASSLFEVDSCNAKDWREGLQAGYLEGVAMQVAANISGRSPERMEEAKAIQLKHHGPQEMPRQASQQTSIQPPASHPTVQPTL